MNPGFVALALFVVVFGLVALLGLRQPLLARLAWREATRRPRQSLLVVVGLMVGSMAITAALIAGDAVGDGLRINGQRAAAAVDLTVGSGGQPFPADVAHQLAADPELESSVEGVQAGIERTAAVTNPDARRRQSGVLLVGFDPAGQDPFGEFVLSDGSRTLGDELAVGEVLVAAELAESLETEVGDEINVPLDDAAGGTLPLKVAGVVEGEGPGAYGWQPALFTAMDTLWEASGERVANVVRVTAAGEVFGGVDEAAEARPVLEAAVERLDEEVGLTVVESKAANMAEAEGGATFISVLLVSLSMVVVAAGVILVVGLAHLLSEERRRSLGVLRALGMRGRSTVRLAVMEGAIYSVAASLIGTALGVVGGWWMGANLLGSFAALGEVSDMRMSYTPAVETVVIAFSLGAVVTVVTLALASRRNARLSIVAALRDHGELLVRRRSGWLRRATQAVLVLASAAALASGEAFLQVMGGFALIGVASGLLRHRVGRGMHASLSGVALLAWAVVMAASVNDMGDEGAAEAVRVFSVLGAVFGLSLLVAANLVFVERALGLAGRLGGRMRATLHPWISELARRPVRTGLATGSFAVAMAVVTVLAALQSVMADAWLHHDGAVDVLVTAPGHAAADLTDVAELDQAVVLSTASYLGPVSRHDDRGSRESESRRAQLQTIPEEPAAMELIELEERAERFESDEQVWEAVRSDPNLVVAASAQPGGTLTFQSVAGPETFEVAARPASPVSHFAVLGSSRSFRSFDGLPAGSMLLGSVVEQADGEEVAAAIERDGFEAGLEAQTPASRAAPAADAFGSMFGALDTIVRLALVVGVATLGISALRAVVERRRSIGVLRSLGYRRRQVVAGMVAEHLVLATIGVAVGVSAGLMMGWILLMDDAPRGVGYSVDAPAVVGAVLVVYAATLLVTIGPARSAGRTTPGA